MSDNTETEPTAPEREAARREVGRTETLIKLHTLKILLGNLPADLAAPADEGLRLLGKAALVELEDIRACDKCDLCEDHHG